MFRSQFFIYTSYFPNKLFLSKNENSESLTHNWEKKPSTDVFLSHSWGKTLVMSLSLATGGKSLALTFFHSHNWVQEPGTDVFLSYNYKNESGTDIFVSHNWGKEPGTDVFQSHEWGKVHDTDVFLSHNWERAWYWCFSVPLIGKEPRGKKMMPMFSSRMNVGKSITLTLSSPIIGEVASHWCFYSHNWGKKPGTGVFLSHIWRKSLPLMFFSHIIGKGATHLQFSLS